MTLNAQDSALVRALIGLLLVIGMAAIAVAETVEQLMLDWHWAREGYPKLYCFPASEVDYEHDEVEHRRLYVERSSKAESGKTESILVEWPERPDSIVLRGYDTNNWIVAKPGDALHRG